MAHSSAFDNVDTVIYEKNYPTQTDNQKSKDMDVNNDHTVRVTVDVNSRLNATLDRLAKENRTSKSEILRRAATLFEAAHEAGKCGDYVGIADDQSKLKTRFIGI